MRATVSGEARRRDGDLARIRTCAGAGTAGEVETGEGRSGGWEEKSSEGLHPVRRMFNETTVKGSSEDGCWTGFGGGGDGWYWTGPSRELQLGGFEAVFIHKSRRRGRRRICVDDTHKRSR